jgi:cytidine deaminase
VYLVVSGPRRGQVWLDAEPVGVVACIASHFIAFFTAWLAALQQAEWPAAQLPAGRCALAQALSGYLGVVEQRLGLAAGALGERELREALSALGPGSVQVVADASRSPLLPRDTVVAPCLACEQLLSGLAEHGMARSALAAPGAWP